MERLLNVLALLRARLWIVPAIMSSTGLALAYAMLGPLRSWADFGSDKIWWLYSGDAGSARNLLGALLSGTMTMTSLVVSLTFVTLTLAANQLGPRLIVNFISDREIQSVLGFFLATILYLILVMRSVGDTLGPDTVPHLAITIASVLTIICMFALLFYVHKISRAIIADTIIEQVYRELRRSIEGSFPEKDAAEPEHTHPAPCDRTHAISLGRAGYIQTIDYPALVKWARDRASLLEVHVRAGDFVLSGGRHIEIVSGDPPASDAVDQIRGAVVIGSERSPAQDVEYSIRQLVELALRALSPGINDPFTAIAALDRLGAAMELILKRSAVPAKMCDEDNLVRVIAIRSTADMLADSCFDQIRQAAAQNTSVLAHLADTLGKLAASRPDEAGMRIISKHIGKLEELSLATGPSASDRAALTEHLRIAREIVATG